MDTSVPRHARMSAAVATHLRDPMRRSAYALILATGLTSGLGLVFWALAARWLPTATVGIGAALVSVMALLANLSTLGLRNGLIRFLPTAGSASRRLIVTCYALCAVTAMAAAGIFLLGQPLWAEKLAFLRGSPLAVLAFIIGTAFWVLFVLQDHVLVGLRQTIWVPLENGLCAVAKIALLPLLAFAGGWAVFGATALPAAAAVLVVTTLIMRYLRRTTAGQEPTAIPVSQLVRFAAADHFAALLWMGTADLLTLLVLNEVGPEASAYYFMANTIGYTLYLVISNVGSALVAEGARHPERSVTLARQALWNSARLVIPLAVIGVLLAPFVLGILGPDYAANGTVVLQLLLISALPQIIVGIAIATARIRRDLRTIMAVYTALAVGSIGGSWLALGAFGLPGVGLACLVTQLVVCAALLITGRTGLFAELGFRSVIAELEQLPRRVRRRRSRKMTRQRLAPALAACGLDPQTAVPDADLGLRHPHRRPAVSSRSRLCSRSPPPRRPLTACDQHAANLTQLRSHLGGSDARPAAPSAAREPTGGTADSARNPAPWLFGRLSGCPTRRPPPPRPSRCRRSTGPPQSYRDRRQDATGRTGSTSRSTTCGVCAACRATPAAWTACGSSCTRPCSGARSSWPGCTATSGPATSWSPRTRTRARVTGFVDWENADGRRPARRRPGALVAGCAAGRARRGRTTCCGCTQRRRAVVWRSCRSPCPTRSWPWSTWCC